MASTTPLVSKQKKRVVMPSPLYGENSSYSICQAVSPVASYPLNSMRNTYTRDKLQSVCLTTGAVA